MKCTATLLQCYTSCIYTRPCKYTKFLCNIKAQCFKTKCSTLCIKHSFLYFDDFFPIVLCFFPLFYFMFSSKHIKFNLNIFWKCNFLCFFNVNIFSDEFIGFPLKFRIKTEEERKNYQVLCCRLNIDIKIKIISLRI